jgi:cytochrome c1
MKKLMTKTLVCSAAAAGLFLAAQAADAAISGACVTCHTMHNSQGGTNMTSGSSAAQDYLLRSQGTCVGCHTGPANQLRNSFGAPTVVHTASTATYPAGGSFYWVNSGADTKGHNVGGTNNVTDSILGNTPPGGDSAAQLECTGCHVGGGHHANTTGGWVTGSSNGAGSYRFLTLGVRGYEDTDWEWTVGSTDHNTYFAGTSTSDANTNTLSTFCAACHGLFHGSGDIGGNSTPWKRHPTDYALPTTGEYSDYDTYDPQSPVGYSSVTTPQFTVGSGANSVVCVSCHRVHGSEHDDMLRWSYNENDAISAGGSSGGAQVGCFVCHTTK